MTIVISSGHGKYVRGASGYLDEVNEARRVVNRVAENLRTAGIEVFTFHDDTSQTQDQNLKTIVNFHNSKTRDLDISVHFNAYETTSSPMGTECLYVTQDGLAANISEAIAHAGDFVNRGPKYRSDLYFLNNTEMPAILIETCFVDSSADAEHYNQYFERICFEITAVLTGVQTPVYPPERPEPPDTSEPGPTGNSVEIVGDITGDVLVVINDIRIVGRPRSRNIVDLGIFLEGNVTLVINGEEFHNYPETPTGLTPKQKREIMEIANGSSIARYNWDDRGIAPVGYIQGMALSFAQSLLRYGANHPAIIDMAKANTGDDDVDALSWYDEEFADFGMSNDKAGVITLRHLYVLLLGLGMRESSGQHCEGRDMSAENTSSDTAEAGLFQTSYNAHSASPQFDPVMDEYLNPVTVDSFLQEFAEGVSCSESDWDCYGSGRGYEFQELCKTAPAFAVESCALTLRNLRQHYGPINRKEAEITMEADIMFQAVQEYLESVA